jgi:hypothetical protein
MGMAGFRAGFWGFGLFVEQTIQAVGPLVQDAFKLALGEWENGAGLQFILDRLWIERMGEPIASSKKGLNGSSKKGLKGAEEGGGGLGGGRMESRLQAEGGRKGLASGEGLPGKGRAVSRGGKKARDSSKGKEMRGSRGKTGVDKQNTLCI